MESLRQHQNQTDSTTKLCASFTHRTEPWPSSTTRTATKVSGSVSTLSHNVRHSPGLPNLQQHWSLSLWRWATECCGYLNYKVMLLHKICALHIAVGFHLSLSSNTPHAVDLWWTILQTRIRSIQTFYLVVVIESCSYTVLIFSGKNNFKTLDGQHCGFFAEQFQNVDLLCPAVYASWPAVKGHLVWTKYFTNSLRHPNQEGGWVADSEKQKAKTTPGFTQ